jgi:peptide/nickel transport system ATP-binding protein/oligopeptide transport system ATP-binding protein
MPDATLLQVDNLVKHFTIRQGPFAPSLVVKAVDDVSFALRERETLAVVGESGCGKSTLGRAVLRLVEPTAGKVSFDGVDVTSAGERALRRLRRNMQMVFQDPYASLNPRMTIGAILGEPLALHGIARGKTRSERVAELLALVGLTPAYAARFPHEFSGGQRQRIGIARALAVGPRLIVGDEPVSALDVSIQAQIINLLQDLQDRLGLSYIIIAHDLTVVKHISDRVAVMYLGKIVELADTRTLFKAPRHPYTRALLSAIPLPDPAPRERVQILQGDVPNPANPPPGCRLQTRCPYVRERCRSDAPALADDGSGHATACHFWTELPSAEPLLAAHARVATPPYQNRLDAIARAKAKISTAPVSAR